MPKIFVQGTLVKARLSIEKSTISPSWHLNAKLTKINNSTAGNSSLLAEIKKLQALKRTDADSVIADGFSQFPQVGT
jgi:hypothetical protein